MQLTKRQFSYIESEISHFHDTKKAIVLLRNELLHGSQGSDENIGGGKSNLPGNPTERKATLLADNKRLNRMQEMASAIETVYERLPDEKKAVVQLRYWNKNNPITWETVADRLYSSRRTVIRYRDEIVYKIAELMGIGS
jgi:RinA family phage transcriptional activator